jgi:hypothetical protein
MFWLEVQDLSWTCQTKVWTPTKKILFLHTIAFAGHAKHFCIR